MSYLVYLLYFTFRAINAGCKRPLLVCPGFSKYEKAPTVALMGALEAAYVVSINSTEFVSNHVDSGMS